MFAGTGPLAKKLDDVPNIKNVGFKHDEALQKLIAQARFSVYPSEWYENCPLSVMESIAAGTPVIGAKIGGIPEGLRSDVDGILFESGNAADLTEKIRELWCDSERLARYTNACSTAQYDTVRQYADKILEIYRG